MALPLQLEKQHALYLAMAIAGAVVLLYRPKLQLWVRGIIFLLGSSEKKGMSKAADSALIERTVKTKTIIFIRHGESEWNEIFNKNKLLLLPRLLMGLLREALMFTVPDDSVFIDSGLSKAGIKRAKKLQDMLQSHNEEPEDEDAAKAIASL